MPGSPGGTSVSASQDISSSAKGSLDSSGSYLGANFGDFNFGAASKNDALLWGLIAAAGVAVVYFFFQRKK